MTIQKLNGPEQKPKSGKKAKQLVIFLHGLGADGNDLIGLSSHFANYLPDAHFISPHAPYQCDLAPFGLQWFSLAIREEEVILAGVKHAAPILNAFIDEQKAKHKLADNQIILIGFSQGTMLSLYTALRRKKPLGAVLAYSGALVAPKLLNKELKSKPPICLVHGEADEIVPFDAFKQARDELQKRHIEVEAYSQANLGHGIDPAGMQIGGEFLKKKIKQ